MRIARIINAALTLSAAMSLASTCVAQTTAVQPANFKYEIRGDSTQTDYMVRPQGDQNNNPIVLVPVSGAQTATAAAAAQPKPEFAYFHLEFTLKQLDNGKVTSTRTYNTDANTEVNNFTGAGRGSYRSNIGTVDPTQPNRGGHDLRINIDWNNLRLAGSNAVVINVNAQVEGLADATMLPNLTTSNEQASADVLAFYGKPTVVFSATGPASRYTTQLEVTATPIHVDAKP